jgi:hypothetical protein
MHGYGTRFVWNSVTSAFRAPSKRRGCSEGGDLRDEAAQVGVRGTLNVEIAMADVVAVFTCRALASSDESLVTRMKSQEWSTHCLMEGISTYRDSLKRQKVQSLCPRRAWVDNTEL